MTKHPAALRGAVFLLFTLLGTGCDLQTKAWAEETLAPLPDQQMEVLEPHVDFVLAYNRGTAFSALGDLGDARGIMGALSLVLAFLLFGAALRSSATEEPPHRQWLRVLAYASIASGAIGNGVDRLFRDAPGGSTGVVDFIRLHYPWGGSWPVFNIADVWVLMGAVLLLVSARKPAAAMNDAKA